MNEPQVQSLLISESIFLEFFEICNRCKLRSKPKSEMSSSSGDREVAFVFPKSGNLFYEKKKEYQFCKPHLMSIRSFTLEKLEQMQLEAQKQLQAKTAETKD